MSTALRRFLLGGDRDVYDPRIFHRITIGFISAWIAMGGDLLGSCMYGPDVLGRASGGDRAVLLVVGAATVATLVLLAWSYMRMVAHFPHGGGGYSAARQVVHERVALISGVALVFDAPLNVAVSVVTCVNAASDALPGGLGAAKLPVELGLIGILALLNLRGVKESVAFLVPIVLAFIATHLVVLGVGLFHAVGGSSSPPVALPAPVAAGDGGWGVLGTMLRAYAMGGAIYTGLEVISNGVPVLREPKIATARKTMFLLAGIPALLIAAIILAYVAFDVRPVEGKTLNATMFENIAGAFGARDGWLWTSMVTLPLAAEAALLIVAAQSGFVDGPRILAALAGDRFMPRRFTRLNGRLAPAPAVLLISGMALVATMLTWGRIQPLLVVFVVAVFVTFTISQWVMLSHVIAGRSAGATEGRRWRLDAGLHGLALVACVVILCGTLLDSWLGSLVTMALILLVVGLCIAIRHRYGAMAEAVQRTRDEVVASVDATLATVPAVPVAAPPLRSAVAVILIGERAQLGSLAVHWLAKMPLGFSGVVLASVALFDADSVQGEERLREAEDRRRQDLEALASEATALGMPASVVVRRGADVLEAATVMIAEIMRDRQWPSVVVGFRSVLTSSAVDPLLRDDLAVSIQARLEQLKIPMVVVSIPLEG